MCHKACRGHPTWAQPHLAGNRQRPLQHRYLLSARARHAAQPKGGRNKSRRPAVRTKFDAEIVPKGRITAMCHKACRGHSTRAQLY
jgi:hypothetical protein